MEDRIAYFERMLADNPDNPTGLMALANEYGKAGRDEDEAAVLQRYVNAHAREHNERKHAPWIRFRGELTKDGVERVEVVSD